MRSPTLSDLPSPPAGRTGFPWTETSLSVPTTAQNGTFWPRISVVTPSYNQATFLEETIRSVLLQGYPDLEYIIIDGGSQDGSAEIIQKYAAHLSYWVSEPDRGQAHAINKGMARSSGLIMGWLNSDDILLPNALRLIAEAFVRNKSISVTCGFRKWIDTESRMMRNWFQWIPEDDFLKRSCIVPQETTYWRRAVWEQLGPLDESFQYALDYEYWQRMLMAGHHFTLLPYYLGAFRQHPASKGSTLDHVREREVQILYRRYGIASSQKEALEQLDRLYKSWRHKKRLLKELCQQRLSDNPRILLAIFRALNTPMISSILLGAHRVYRRIKRSISDSGH